MSSNQSPLQSSVWRTSRALIAADNAVDRLFSILAGPSPEAKSAGNAVNGGLCYDVEELSKRAEQLENRLQGLVALIEDSAATQSATQVYAKNAEFSARNTYEKSPY